MMTWIKKHEPPIVILENVCGAPWDKIAERFRQQGYQADYTRLDTKRYYIPHTRTRVYLVAVRKNPGETFIPADFPTEFKAIGSLASKEVKDKEGNAKKMKPTGKKLVNRLSEDADVAEQKARPPHTGPHTTAFAW
jgi:site-specific DNA-cytosine methylase